MTWSPGLSHTYHSCAKILAFEQADEGSWRLFQTVYDFLTIMHLAVLHPRLQLLAELSVTVAEAIEDDEALDAQFPAQYLAHQPVQPIPSIGQSRCVVLGHQTTHRYARIVVL